MLKNPTSSLYICDSGPVLHLASLGIMFLEIPYIFMGVEGWAPCLRLELKHYVMPEGVSD